MKTDPARNTAQPKSRRRWYQYTLRTLLIGVTLAGLRSNSSLLATIQPRLLAYVGG